MKSLVVLFFFFQHRMRPDIARLLTPHIYEKLENHPSVFNYEDIKVCIAPVFTLFWRNVYMQYDKHQRINSNILSFRALAATYSLWSTLTQKKAQTGKATRTCMKPSLW